jgi:hypothetical protein
MGKDEIARMREIKKQAAMWRYAVRHGYVRPAQVKAIEARMGDGS